MVNKSKARFGVSTSTHTWGAFHQFTIIAVFFHLISTYFTLWQSNIAIENGPFIVGLPAGELT